jgi:hypothetical protein
VTLACPNWDEIGMTRSGDSGAFRPSPPAPRQLNVQAAQRAQRSPTRGDAASALHRFSTPIDRARAERDHFRLHRLPLGDRCRKSGDPVTTRLSAMSGCPALARHDTKVAMDFKLKA